MFEQLFGNVFGKSKKSTTTNGKQSEKEESASDKSGNLYPSILLTDQMLKGESGTPPFEVVNFESSSSSSRTPFKTNDSVIVSSNSRQKAFSPLDNIPFHILSSGGGSGGTDNGLSDLNECFSLLNSVAGHLSNPSSEYKFVLEKSVIMNSLD